MIQIPSNPFRWQDFAPHERYTRARTRMRTGDIIAMGDDSFLSRLVRFRTRSDAGHVGMVYKTQGFVELLEAVRTGWFSGEIAPTRLSQRVAEYVRAGGRMWWLPLSEEVRANLDEDRLIAAMAAQEGVKYDLWGAIASGTIFSAKPDPKTLFCSESCAYAFQQAGILPPAWNYSETSPQELIALRLYARAVPLVGDLQEPRGFNAVDPVVYIDGPNYGPPCGAME